MKKGISETSFRRDHVRSFLDKLPNSFFFPIQQLALTGDPDYVGVINGRFVALELKRAKGKPRKLQQYKLDRVEKAQGVSLVADPDNWEDVKATLLTLATRRPLL